MAERVYREAEEVIIISNDCIVIRVWCDYNYWKLEKKFLLNCFTLHIASITVYNNYVIVSAHAEVIKLFSKPRIPNNARAAGEGIILNMS